MKLLSGEYSWIICFALVDFRADLAEEYSRDKKKFFKNAEEFTKKHGEKRPTD